MIPSSTTVRDFDSVNWVANENLPREAEPSRRLHEPMSLINTIDPITGKDIGDLTGRPTIVDGNVVMYFESEQTRKEYLDMPLDHPFHLIDNTMDEGVDEG
jgi:hypothetical protein